MSILWQFNLEKLWLLPIIFILFLIVHAVKIMRLYLIVIDERIPFKRFLFLYFATTLVNLLIPLKLGEFFRIFVFSRETKSFRIGFLSVLLDRFFDTVALVLILLPYELLSVGTVKNFTLLLSVFVVVFVFVYLAFPSCYTYLNRYLIINRTSKGSMGSLKALEMLRMGYDYVKRQIFGRYSLLVIFSFVAWLLECGVLYLTSLMKGLGDADFSAYITTIISSSQSELARSYLLICIIIIALLTVVSFLIALFSGVIFTKEHRSKR